LTPICNCPDNIGWLPESSWGYAEASKSSGERIYCVDGVPKVHPRPKFVGNYGTATLSDSYNFSLTGSGEISAESHSVDGRVTVTNNQAYTVHLMGMLRFDWYISLGGANDAETLAISPRIYTDAGVAKMFTQRAGTIDANAPHQYINGSFLVYLGTLAAYDTVRYYCRHFWTAAGGETATSLDFTSSLVVFGGAAA
jgi:hypothetical protein